LHFVYVTRFFSDMSARRLDNSLCIWDPYGFCNTGKKLLLFCCCDTNECN